MFFVAQNTRFNSPIQHVISSEESVQPAQLTDEQMTKLKSILLLCLCLFLLGISVTSGSQQRRGLVTAEQRPDLPWNLNLTP